VGSDNDIPLPYSPESAFAVDAAELLSRFLPFDPNRFRVDVDGFSAEIDAAVPEWDDILTSAEVWGVAAVAAILYATRSRAKGRRQSERVANFREAHLVGE
jgi:hypothetical protein